MTGSARRIIVAIVGLGVAILPSAALAHPAAARAARLGAPDARGLASRSPLADPTSNSTPSQAFFKACYSMGRSKADNDKCDAVALHDFDKARAREGLGPMRLPGGFDRLPVPLQLLAISDVERVDRGLPPVIGLSSNLNSLAQQGADDDQDPPFPNPFYGSSGGGNWAGAGSSALLDDFFWMYDDGLGSGNIDCTQSNRSGCWGHRHNVIGDYDGPLLLGTAVAYDTPDGASMTEEFIGGDATDTADVAPSWATMARAPASLAISASKHAIALHHRLTVTGTVAAWDPHDHLAGQRVALQRRRPHRHWTDLSTKRTGSRGQVRFHLRPARTAKYRIQVRAAGKVVELTSRVVKIVTRR